MILFDLDMPKWVLFFYPIMKRLDVLGRKYKVVSRGGEGYEELNRVLELYNIPFESIGRYGGGELEGKLRASIDREIRLIDIIKESQVNVVVSGSVVDANRVAFGLGKKIINFYDMPLKDCGMDISKALPQIRLTMPLSSKVFKPFNVPDEVYERLGVEKKNIINYNFLDPLIWLKDFQPDVKYIKKRLGYIDNKKPIIVVREEEFKAGYVQKKDQFLYDAIDIMQDWNINLIIIPRYESKWLKNRFKKAKVLEEAIILQNLLVKADLFIGGGGTINIEAAYFGTPVISTRSFISHYDKYLIDHKLMWHSNSAKEILFLAKKIMGKNLKDRAKNIFSSMIVDMELFVNQIVEFDK